MRCSSPEARDATTTASAVVHRVDPAASKGDPRKAQGQAAEPALAGVDVPLDDESEDELVDELIGWGTPAEQRAFVQRYAAAGATPVIALVLPPGADQAQALRDLAPQG